MKKLIIAFLLIASTAWAFEIERQHIPNGFIYNLSEYDNGNSSTADTISFDNGNKQKSTLIGSATLTLTAPTTGVGSILLRLIQDGTGSRVVTWAASSGSVLWPGGTAPTLTTAANAVDMVSCYWNGANFYCAANLDMK